MNPEIAPKKDKRRRHTVKGKSADRSRSLPVMRIRLEQFYGHIATHTSKVCGAPCGRPGFCCKPEFCEATARYAREAFDVQLPRTKHPELPFMGQHGCTVPPHLRPTCSIYVCEKHLAEDKEFAEMYKYFRDEIDMLELKLNSGQQAVAE